MRKVMVTGTFDVLHEGHVDLFRQAKKHGEFLIVVIARDATVQKIKGKLPDNNEKARLKEVSSCSLVSKAILGNVKDKYKVIEAEKPDRLCLGYDQEAFTEDIEEKLAKRGIKTKVTRLKPYKPEIYKSSIIKEKN